MTVHQLLRGVMLKNICYFKGNTIICGGPIVTKSRYNEGIPQISRKYSNFDSLIIVDQGPNYRVFNKEKWGFK